MSTTLFQHNQQKSKDYALSKSAKDKIKEIYYNTPPRGNEEIEQWLAKRKFKQVDK